MNVLLFFQVHTHPSRQGHSPKALTVPDDVASHSSVPRHMMKLFAVLCIKTSHYVSFIKYGPDPHSWLFFDSMADRCGKIDSSLSLFDWWLLLVFCSVIIIQVIFSDVRANHDLFWWLPMMAIFADNAASTKLDKAMLWRLWHVIFSWADV